MYRKGKTSVITKQIHLNLLYICLNLEGPKRGHVLMKILGHGSQIAYNINSIYRKFISGFGCLC